VEKEHGVKKCTCKGPPTYICIYKQERGFWVMITTILIEAL
jgi:hypothetical protein